MKLEEIETMLEAATGGKSWAMAFEPDKHIVIGEDIQGGSCVVVIPNEGGYRQERQRDKARFIAAAPTIIRELVERVRRLENTKEQDDTATNNGTVTSGGRDSDASNKS